MPYLTPDGADFSTLLIVPLPDNNAFRGVVLGGITEGLYPESWEEYGNLTPDDAAQYFRWIYQALIIRRTIVYDNTYAFVYDNTGEYLYF